jgi:hypothetical protein
MRELFPSEVTERFERHPELFAQFLSVPPDSPELYRRLGRTLEISPGMVERLADLVQLSARHPAPQQDFLAVKSRRPSSVISAKYFPQSKSNFAPGDVCRKDRRRSLSLSNSAWKMLGGRLAESSTILARLPVPVSLLW